MPDQSDIIVLRGKAHGLPPEEYVSALQNRIDDYTVSLAKSPYRERELIENALVATGRHLESELINRANRLGLYLAASSGVEHLPLDQLEDENVVVSNGAGIHADNMAEHVIAKLLIFARGFMKGFRQQAAGRWQHYQPFGDLNGSTVTIVGLGAVGATVAERLSAFDVETIGIRHSPEKGGPVGEVYGYDRSDVHDAFGRSDYVVLACPLTETTEGLVNDVALELMQSDAVLVNVGRGPIVDTDALVDAIRGNEIRGAALDVTDPEPLPGDHPLWDLEDVLITPHVAGYTPEYWDRLADILTEALNRYETDGTFENAPNRVL